MLYEAGQIKKNEMAGTRSMGGKDERFILVRVLLWKHKFLRARWCTQEFLWQWVECEGMDWVHLARDRLFWTQ